MRENRKKIIIIKFFAYLMHGDHSFHNPLHGAAICQMQLLINSKNKNTLFALKKKQETRTDSWTHDRFYVL